MSEELDAKAIILQLRAFDRRIDEIRQEIGEKKRFSADEASEIREKYSLLKRDLERASHRFIGINDATSNKLERAYLGPAVRNAYSHFIPKPGSNPRAWQSMRDTLYETRLAIRSLLSQLEAKYPNATNQGDGRIRIGTKHTKLGEWCISADPEAFKISAVSYGVPYFLTIGGFPSFVRETTRDFYEHVRAVAEHRTGLPEWDRSKESVTDYFGEWHLEIDKRFQMNLVASYLHAFKSSGSIREMVDYFEHKHSYCLDRNIIDGLLTELVTTGQIDKLPSMSMAPAEMSGLARIAEVWLKTDSSDTDELDYADDGEDSDE